LSLPEGFGPKPARNTLGNDQEDRMSEWTDKIEGTVKEKEGELTGDDVREKQGELQKEKGNAEGKLDEIRDDIKEKL
jgi:uncharacterized protein YjbJ (UPF0337 family)